ncbi:unnamed protein product [Meganyctiphanes norvegica]|uniref:Smr domain-containing protein n=1 Tax=Meganyctiphanes norvegica TaxID=48144 RepID=A0AAV2RY90_MEGNR
MSYLYHWLWVSGAVLVVILILALCCPILSNCICCPKPRPGPVLPYTISYSVGSRQIPASSSDSSPLLHLHHLGSISQSQILRTEEGFPTLDLHGMTVLEARNVTQQFLRRNRGVDVRVVTGRGLHSEGGRSKIRPVILKLLAEQRIKATQIHNGGCLQIKVP